MLQATRLFVLAMASGISPSASPSAERALMADLEIESPPAAVFEAWTTVAGIRSFFAPSGVVEPHVDGAYEILFFPDNPPGQRGAEGMRILAFEPPSRLAFTWDAPPSIPDVRKQRTMVILDFEPLDGGRSRLRFRHVGWGSGPVWDQAFEYFDKAWGGVVLPRLVHRFAQGPIDWSAPPRLAPVAATLKRRLQPVP